jgi:hypothetical protein
MTLERDPNEGRTYGTRINDVLHATRRREGLGTIVAVVVLSALIIVGLSYVIDSPPADPNTETPPATYRAQ